MDVDLNKIKSMLMDAKDLNAYIASELQRGGPEDPPYLSSCITGFDQGGVYWMEALALQYEQEHDIGDDKKRTLWKIQVLCDEWGNKPIPGEYVTRKIQKPLEHAPGKPLTSMEITIDKMNGVYDDKWTRSVKYKIDAKGCISVRFSDASYLLNVFGIHGKSGSRMSQHTKPHSGDPVKAPNGNMIHVHYWRFKEVDREMYAALPKITEQEIKQRNEKRGHKVEEKLTA